MTRETTTERIEREMSEEAQPSMWEEWFVCATILSAVNGLIRILLNATN